jgi:hypothetical protein
MLSFKIPRCSDERIDSRKITDEMFNEICSLTPWVEDTSRKSLREHCYCLVHNITEQPKCENCSNDVNFSYTSGKYRTSCSEQCKMIIAKNKQAKTCLAKYGVENPAQSEVVKSKMRESCLKKYGVEYALQSEELKEKSKQTCLSKYGVEYATQNENVREKYKQTCQEKYGVENTFQSEDIKEKTKQTRLEKYGVEHVLQNKVIKAKMSISKANNFQARRNEQGTDYAGSVYILHFPQHSAVKIGLTGDFEKRSKGLISDFGEFDVINIIETQECYALESSLHQKFANYRICIDEGCGRTEFFKDEILEKLRTFEL